MTKAKMTAVVCALIVGGAFHGKAHAEATPPVLKQTATIEETCTIGLGCRNQGAEAHQHLGINNASLAENRKFKLNKKFFRRWARFVDIQDEWFDEIQRPDLFIIHADKPPLSSDNFVLSQTCQHADPLDCMNVTDFPLAFGIRLLENADKSTTPHAFIYVPARGPEQADKLLGTGFMLSVLHIPDDALDCERASLPVVRRHCVMTRDLADYWATSPGKDAMKNRIRSSYRTFFDQFFKGYRLQTVDGMPRLVPDQYPCNGCLPDVGVPNWPRISLPNVYKYLGHVGPENHNDIIHGNLK